MGREMKGKDCPQGRENLKVKGRKEKVVECKGEGKRREGKGSNKKEEGQAIHYHTL